MLEHTCLRAKLVRLLGKPMPDWPSAIFVRITKASDLLCPISLLEESLPIFVQNIGRLMHCDNLNWQFQ